VNKLVNYYEAKTRTILARYGPGPRVHYHTGLLNELASVDAQGEDLRRLLVSSQERMLWYAAATWDARLNLSGDVLDVGCGLGGGSIFWAQEFGAKVTAVTIAPSHVELVERFAEQAGVGPQVQPLLCDALAVPGESCFDTAIAIDSSSSFQRKPWFHRLASLVRSGGCVFIFDCFLIRDEYREPFDRHWCAQIGTINEYLAAAEEANFVVKRIEDVSAQAVNFWRTTVALMHTRANECLNYSQRAELEDSLRTHALVRQGLVDGGLCHVLLSFVRV